MTIKNKTISINVLVQVLFGTILLILLYRHAVSTFLQMKKESTRAIIEGQSRELAFAFSKPLEMVNDLAKDEKVIAFMTEKSKVSNTELLMLFDHVSIGREFSNLYLLNDQGDVVISKDPSFLNNNFSYRNYFNHAMSGISHIQLAFGVLTHKPGYYFSSPIRDQGKIVGVVVLKVEVDYIDKLFDNSPTKKIGHYFLTDEFGVVISTDKEIDPYQSLGKITEEKLEKLRIERRFEGFGVKPLQYQLVQDKIDNYKGPESIEFLDKEDGEDEEGEFELVQMQQVDYFPFYLVTESSLDSIYGSIFSIVRPIMLLLVSSLLIGILIQYLLYRQMFNPLTKLEKYTKDVASSKEVDLIDIRTGDEIESLSQSVGTMVKTLKDTQSQLENLINTKTEELSTNVKELAAKNALMSQNEEAMLNILEDSKELEKQLEIEKKGVEQKVVERTRELNDEQAKLLASISALPGAFIIVDNNYQILIQNGRLDKIFAVTDKDWSLEKIDNLLGNNFELRKKIQTVIEQKKIFDIDEFSYGSRFLQLYVAPVSNNDGELIGVILTINDVTEEKVLNRSKDEFFSIASHELRTPLTAIRGNTSMIMEYYSDLLKNKDLKEMINDTHVASIRLIEIVNDFLDVSRLEQGKMEYKLTKTELNKIVDKILKDFDQNAKKEGVELKLEAEKEFYAMIDPGKFEQILINLIGNALKFTDQGQIKVKISEKNAKISVEVSDTGRGIAIQNQALLFHKFQQAGSSLITRDGAKGTGLGLYIAKLMAEGMGGKLRLVKSVLDEGSIFEFELPAINEENI